MKTVYQLTIMALGIILSIPMMVLIIAYQQALESLEHFKPKE